jgi:putative acetyltransferase
MSIDDYAAVADLWRSTEGIGMSDSDTEVGVRSFLVRNPDMSAVAVSPPGEIVGAVLCGHDGRRGYMHHLAIVASHRKRGIAARLIAWCHERLAVERIQKCNVFLFSDNADGASFWRHNDWVARDDLRVFQKMIR